MFPTWMTTFFSARGKFLACLSASSHSFITWSVRLNEKAKPLSFCHGLHHIDRNAYDKKTHKHTPVTSFHGVWPLGFLWLSGSLCVRCRHRVIPDSDPRRLEDWGPLLALDDSPGRGGNQTQSSWKQSEAQNRDKQMTVKKDARSVNAGKTLKSVGWKPTMQSVINDPTCLMKGWVKDFRD